MKAKRFREFIVETKVREDWTGAKLWFDEETDFRELLGQDIWQVRTAGITEQQLKDFIRRLELDFDVVAQSIILTSSPNTFALWFSLDKRLLQEMVGDWSDGLTDEVKRYIDVFKSNASGVDKILDRGDDDLTEDQLVQLLSWVEGRDLSREFLESITLRIKAHPNWPEDMTDWALGDW